MNDASVAIYRISDASERRVIFEARAMRTPIAAVESVNRLLSCSIRVLNHAVTVAV
jgi:hypothetical protein